MVTSLNPTLATFLAEHKTLFQEILARQIHLIKSRSQAFEDCHITVYDKVLLALTKNGNDLETPAAIEYFCEEYLAINPNGVPAQNQKILQRSVALPLLLSQGKKTFPSTSTDRSN